MENLPALRAFVGEACHQMRAPEDACFGLQLAVDEICANIITHGYADLAPGRIALAVTSNAREIVVTITDNGKPFDPGDAPPPDLTGDWQERRVGGLGLFFTRQTVDEVKYKTEPGRGNVLTLRKKLRQPESRTSGREPMQLTVEQREPVTVVALAGSIDALTASAVTDALAAQIKAGHIRLVADMTQVDYTSSAGLRAILGTLKDARQHGGDLRLAGLWPNVKKVLDLSGFTAILKFFPDVDAAAASYAA